jgi:cytochrome b involved in lipid metabolism
MKKILPFLFLASLIIFAIFIVISLAKSNPPIQSTTQATPTLTSSTACIITINSQKYDVTQYRFQHPGGNVFQCGTDMSTIFADKHPQSYLNKIQSYLIP